MHPYTIIGIGLMCSGLANLIALWYGWNNDKRIEALEDRKY